VSGMRGAQGQRSEAAHMPLHQREARVPGRRRRALLLVVEVQLGQDLAQRHLDVVGRVLPLDPQALLQRRAVVDAPVAALVAALRIRSRATVALHLGRPGWGL